MDPTRQIKLRWLHGTLADVSVTRVQLWQVAPQAWTPAVNAFICEQCIRICVELAGVAKSEIDIVVETQRLSVRGYRDAPEPTEVEGRALRTLAMEIDYGLFERVLDLPRPVDVKKASAQQENGFLWIYLPLTEK